MDFGYVVRRFAGHLLSRQSRSPDRDHHPIFKRFTPFKGNTRLNHHHDFAGMFTSADFDGGMGATAIVSVVTPIPAVNEEYFEWIDLLSSVEAAKENYVVVEVGAGYGRWAGRAVLMAQKRGLTCKAILVEAEPVHAKWAAEHMVANSIRDFSIIEAAAGGSRGKATFAVQMPGESRASAKDWYGQALFPGEGQSDGQYYEGKPVLNVNGWGAIEIDVLPLADILANVERVDFLDMDVQNAEGDVIEGALDVLDAKVSFLHIGTHSADVEHRIRQALRQRGWRALWDFPCATTGHPTPFGPVDFQDGVQSWRNPRFERQG